MLLGDFSRGLGVFVEAIQIGRNVLVLQHTVRANTLLGLVHALEEVDGLFNAVLEYQVDNDRHLLCVGQLRHVAQLLDERLVLRFESVEQS